jgi:hypothetical protein
MHAQQTRSAFDRKLYSTTPLGRRWANYEDLNSLKHAPRLAALRTQFHDGQLGEKTGARAAAWREVRTLGRAGSHVLELFLALFKVRLAGSIAEQSEIARHIDRLIAPCKLRKARYGLKELVSEGWLAENPLPTGRHKQRSNGRWTTCQIVQYTLTPKSISLISGQAAGRVDPSSLSNVSKSPRVGVTNPRQCLPPTVREEPSPPFLRQGGEEFRQVDQHKETPRGDFETFDKEDGSTRPAAWPNQTADLRTTSRESADGAGSIKRSSASGSDRTATRRKNIPRTWQHGRRAFLEDLAVITNRLTYLSPNERAAILAAAASQTAANYNLALGSVLDWRPLVLRWLDLPWSERDDEIRARIVPALRAALIPAGPARPTTGRPNEKLAREIRIAQEKRDSRDANARPKVPIDSVELQQLRERLYIARMTARAIASGRMSFEDLSPDVRDLVKRCAEVFGPLVG